MVFLIHTELRCTVNHTSDVHWMYLVQNRGLTGCYGPSSGCGWSKQPPVWRVAANILEKNSRGQPTRGGPSALARCWQLTVKTRFVANHEHLPRVKLALHKKKTGKYFVWEILRCTFSWTTLLHGVFLLYIYTFLWNRVFWVLYNACYSRQLLYVYFLKEILSAYIIVTQYT